MSRLSFAVSTDRQLSNRHLTLLLVLMCTGLALTIAANVSLNVALPAFSQDLGATQSQLSWVMNAYTLPFAALLLPAGDIADRIGLRLALTVGLLIFGISSLVASMLTDPAGVIALRVVSGLGATLVLPATLSVLTRAYPAERRAKAVGIWAAVSGAGTVVGLLLGGLFMLFFWWGSVLASTGIAAVLAAIVSYAVVPTYKRQTSKPLDIRGSVLFALGLGLLVFAFIQGPELGWATAVIAGSFAAGSALLVSFVLAQLRTPEPLLDVRLFRSNRLSVASLAIVIQFAATIGLFLLLPQMLQNVREYGALLAAVALVPLPVGIAIGSQFAEPLQRRLGERSSVAGGTAVAALGFGWLGVQTASAPYWWLGVALVMFGVGFGLSTTTATTMIINAVPGEDNSTAAALNDALREVGAAIGIAVLGTVLNMAYRSRVDDNAAGLDGGLLEQIRNGFGPALQAAESMRELAGRIVLLAREAFYGGYQVAVFWAAGLLVVTAVVVLLAGPRRGSRSTD